MISGQKRNVTHQDELDGFEEIAPPEPLDTLKSLATPVRRAIHQTRQWLLAQQDADGSWCAELEGDTILESETILLMAFLGHEDSPLTRRLAAYIVEKQLPGRRLGNVSGRQH